MTEEQSLFPFEKEARRRIEDPLLDGDGDAAEVPLELLNEPDQNIEEIYDLPENRKYLFSELKKLAREHGEMIVECKNPGTAAFLIFQEHIKKNPTATKSTSDDFEELIRVIKEIGYISFITLLLIRVIKEMYPLQFD